MLFVGIVCIKKVLSQTCDFPTLAIWLNEGMFAVAISYTVEVREMGGLLFRSLRAAGRL